MSVAPLAHGWQYRLHHRDRTEDIDVKLASLVARADLPGAALRALALHGTAATSKPAQQRKNGQPAFPDITPYRTWLQTCPKLR